MRSLSKANCRFHRVPCPSSLERGLWVDEGMHAGVPFYENDNRVRRYAETLAGRGDVVEVIALRRPHRSRRYQSGAFVSSGFRRAAKERTGEIVLYLTITSLLLGPRHLFVIEASSEPLSVNSCSFRSGL